MYLVQGVEGRSGIRIHGGNVAGNVEAGLRSDFMGCIAFGSSTGKLHGQRAVLGTNVVIRKIEKFLDYQDFILIIIGDFDE